MGTGNLVALADGTRKTGAHLYQRRSTITEFGLPGLTIRTAQRDLFGFPPVLQEDSVLPFQAEVYLDLLPSKTNFFNEISQQQSVFMSLEFRETSWQQSLAVESCCSGC